MNARPKKPESELSDKFFRFTVTQGEKEEIEGLAKQHGYKRVSDYLRRTALGFQAVDRSCLEKE